MSEADEIADQMIQRRGKPASIAEAERWVKEEMPDQGYSVRCAVEWALCNQAGLA